MRGNYVVVYVSGVRVRGFSSAVKTASAIEEVGGILRCKLDAFRAAPHGTFGREQRRADDRYSGDVGVDSRAQRRLR